MSEPQLRAKMRQGLLKVEQLHALARAVYLRAARAHQRPRGLRPDERQAREISRLAAAPDFPLDPDLLRHVSPVESKNVILYGEIKIDPAKRGKAAPADPTAASRPTPAHVNGYGRRRTKGKGRAP